MLNSNKLYKQYAEIIFLDYIDKQHPPIENDYPNYLKEELDVSDTYVFIKKLVRAGYAKAQDQHYELTQTGEELLAEHQDYVSFFVLDDLYITIQEYLQRKKDQPDKSFEQLMIELLAEKAAECREKKEFLKEKKIRLDLATLYERVDDKVQALQNYLTVLYMDLNAVEYLNDLQNYREGKCKREHVKSSYDFTYFRPDVQAGLKRLQDVYTAQYSDAVYADCDMGVQPCDKEHFVAIVKEIMDDTFCEMEWQKYFTAAFTKLLDSVKK